MPKRRQINADPDAPTLRSKLDAASEPVRAAAWTVEERVLWRVVDRCRPILEAAKWPFQRIAFFFEQRLVWPLQERAADAGVTARTVGGGALATVAVSATVAGAVLLAGGSADSDPAAPPVAAAPTASPVVKAAPEAAAEPVLKGAPPSFGVGSGSAVNTGGSGAGSGAQGSANADTVLSSGEEPATTSSSKPPVPAGPAAMKVARRFADAFVYYEVGERQERNEEVFAETTTPRLAAALAERPPRQPEGIKVPQARVLNLVPGPRSGKAYTVSASLLRVGTTSELRLELKKLNGNWRVTDVRG